MTSDDDELKYLARTLSPKALELLMHVVADEPPVMRLPTLTAEQEAEHRAAAKEISEALKAYRAAHPRESTP